MECETWHPPTTIVGRFGSCIFDMVPDSLFERVPWIDEPSCIQQYLEHEVKAKGHNSVFRLSQSVVSNLTMRSKLKDPHENV